MWDFLAQYGLFLAKSVTVVLAFLVVAVGLISVASGRVRSHEGGHIEVRKLNERLEGMRDALREASLDAREFKRQLKSERKAERKAEKAKRKKPAVAAEPDAAQSHPRFVYVLNFHGDLRAHAVDTLREEVTAVLTRAETSDAVMVRIESGGGLVHSYGLAAAQLARIRDAGVPLTVCVDKVAASGGYLMACVAERIVAAPFAMLGSIGVVAQIPNFHRLLHKHDVDYEVFTAGQYKRTLTVFGRNTEAGRQKFSEELEDTHTLFKEFVARYRPGLDMTAVATGEVWFGERALGLGLADGLGTSDDWLQKAALHSDVLEVRYIERKRLGERLGFALESAIARGVTRAVAGIGAREDWLR